MSTAERQLLTKLSPAEKRALQLKSSGETRATAAAKLGVSPNHVKNLWQAARRKARALGQPIFRELHGSTATIRRMSSIDPV